MLRKLKMEKKKQGIWANLRTTKKHCQIKKSSRLVGKIHNGNQKPNLLRSKTKSYT